MSLVNKNINKWNCSLNKDNILNKNKIKMQNEKYVLFLWNTTRLIFVFLISKL